MRKISALFIILLYFGIMFLPVIAALLETATESGYNPFDYARITDVDYTAVLVDEPTNSGKVIITERLTYDIHAASKNNLFWELWRDLPEDYIDGLKVDYKVNSVKQILEDGTEIIYGESPKLYWEDEDYVDTYRGLGPGKWFHSPGPYSEYNDQYECVFFYVDGLYREKITFEIEYEMNNAAAIYNDCSELYLCMYSEGTIKHLNSFKGQILIPNKDMPTYGNYEAYTYGTNAGDFPFIESDDLNPGYHTFAFNLDEKDLKFNSENQYIEFDLIALGNEKHKFTTYTEPNLYSRDDILPELQEEHEEYVADYKATKRSKVFVLLICLGSSYLVLDYCFKIKKKMNNKHTFYTASMQMDYFRDIPSDLDPNFAAALVFCKKKPKKDTTDGYAAMMLSLVRKKYIELERIVPERSWTLYNVKIVVKYKPKPVILPLFTEASEAFFEEENNEPELEPLTTAEQQYFNLINRYANMGEISLSSFQSKISMDYLNTDSFVKSIERSITTTGVALRYFQKSNFDEPKNHIKNVANTFRVFGILFVTLINFISYFTPLGLAFGAFTILGITFILSSIKLNLEAGNFVLLTQLGEDEYVKWRGLYEFLNSETLMNERTVVELPIWEKYLIYATAFGISEKVVKALNIRCPEFENYDSSILNNSYYRSSSFHHSSRSFRTATRSASHSARSGGYGGYGSASRGGGGGGGGH